MRGLGRRALRLVLPVALRAGRLAMFIAEEILMGLGVVARACADGGYGAADLCYGGAAKLRAKRLG